MPVVYTLSFFSQAVHVLSNKKVLMVPALLCRYDSFTGVPVCQQNLSLEKASILFNMAALFSQIGTRCNRQATAGLEEASSSFQKAAGMQGGGAISGRVGCVKQKPCQK